MTSSADVRPTRKIAKVVVPDLLAEGTGIQGFVFSRKLLQLPDLEKYTSPKTDHDLQVARNVAQMAWKIAEESDGGPGVGENYVSITISNNNANAGSGAEKLYLYFGGEGKFLRLWGLEGSAGRFPRGTRITWDMSVGTTSPENWIETVPTDAWDDLLLVNPSGDGMLIDNIKVVHSSITIVDWPPPGESLWLDGSRDQKYGIIGLADQILTKKLEAIPADLRWVPQLHWAVLELGKTDGKKYGTTHQWCSEFASWCLRKAGWWEAPRPARLSDNIDSDDMQSFFERMGRKYTRDDIKAGRYTPIEGDYVKFPDHSALFVRFEDDGCAVTDEQKRFVSIDGNNGSKVTLASGSGREIRDMVSVGSTR